ncbi:MAG: flavodoxin family protein [Selenomonadaceae bacterium]|nr:flavodoxin family protein [Selenomonadaceae bacterium]
MSKKIVVLNGSPRAKGNTSALVEEFARGAREAGCEVEIFHLDKMNIHGCKGCFGGGKNPEHPCVQRDDMDKIYPAYKAADLVALATPLYYWNFSGQLRTAFDRLFAVAECDPNYQNPKKESVLLMAAEGYGFDDALTYYQNLMKHLGWTERGHVLAGGVMKVGDIKGHKELAQAYELGKTVAGGNGL